MKKEGGTIPVQFVLNSKPVLVEVPAMSRLLDVLRGELRQTGIKEGCGEGECGACAVLLDGKLVNSCLVPAVQLGGASVTTVEGLDGDPDFIKLQEVLVEEGGTQCGFCTPAVALALYSLFQRNNKSVSDAKVKLALSGNLCRCTGYGGVLRAARRFCGVTDVHS